MVKKIIIGSLITVVLVGGLFAFYGFSYMKYHTPEMMLNWKVDMLTEELNLNDNQKQKLDELKEEILLRWTEMREDRGNVVEDVVELIEQETFDQAAFNNLITERRTKIGEMIPELIEYFAAFQSTLTADQKVRLGEIIKNHSNCGYHSSGS